MTVHFGWHFVADDMRLGYDDGRRVVVGETLSLPPGPPPKPCVRGMHASEEIGDALKFAPGAQICRVAVWGDMRTEHDKLCGRHRHVLWKIDGTALLRQHAADVAQWALEQELQAGRDVDPRSYAAVAHARLMAGGADRDPAAESAAESAARSAAWSAAESAAWSAAESAAWSAARSAARSAAESAARSAAWSAAESAAESAAWSAAESDARSAARSAARSIFNEWLTYVVIDTAKEQGVWVEDCAPEGGE